MQREDKRKRKGEGRKKREGEITGTILTKQPKLILFQQQAKEERKKEKSEKEGKAGEKGMPLFTPNKLPLR